MFNKSLISTNVNVYKDEWPFQLEYSNYLLNDHVSELLCGSAERNFNRDIYYQIDWKKVNPNHNEIIRAVYELPPNFKGYAKDKKLCNQEKLKEVLKLETDKINERQSKRFPGYSFEMYKPQTKMEEID
ncbi:hypothetical protein G6F43_012894 [Rhizopus delemar]|nr:hypothetical protein G6F43_012894 [Rhizopus delemar]